MGRNTDTYLLQCFAYEQLPEEQQQVARQFHDLAHVLMKYLPDNSDRVSALRKLIEAKDRAMSAWMCACDGVT